MAIAAMVVGIVATFVSWTVAGGIVGGLIAVGLGVVGSGRASRLIGRSGSGMAKAGVATGVIAVLLGGASILGWQALSDASEPTTMTFETDNTPDAEFPSDVQLPGAEPETPEIGPYDGYCNPNTTKIDPDC